MFSAASKTDNVSSAATYIEDVFSTYLYTGNAPSTQTITNGIDLSTKGGLVWLKYRDGTQDHVLIDTVRGNNKELFSNQTYADYTETTPNISSFNTNGFGLQQGSGYFMNTNGANYVSWTFRKQAKFFDIVTYTGTGATQAINHNLGSAPGCIMIKSTTENISWFVYHRGTGNQYVTQLQSTAAQSGPNNVFWNSTDPTSTQFTVGSYIGVNRSGESYVAYLFAHDAGGFGAAGTDNVISCGSYSGNGGTLTVNLGYEPQWLLVKRTDSTGNWALIDVMRGWVVGASTQQQLYANTSGAETGDSFFGPTATGFSANLGGTWNTSGANYIYIAIRRGPMKTPTSGTSVFSPTTRTGTNSAATVTGVGFAPDLFLTSDRNAAAHGGISGSVGVFVDKLRGGNNYLISQNAGAEGSGVNISFQNTGISYGGSDLNTSPYDYANWFFVRAPSFMDEVCYTGTGSPQNINHNLTVAPEMIITKIRNFGTYAWRVYHSALGNGKALYLNLDYAVATATGFWNDTNPTASVFTVGSDAGTNASGYNMVAYLFASCPGVSKVGSYTGTGATLTVSCGFAARWVMIKRTDSTGDWWVWDTARGMIAGTDPRLAMNSSAAEVNANWVYTDASGFQIVTTDATVNASGGSYIFLAVA